MESMNTWMLRPRAFRRSRLNPRFTATRGLSLACLLYTSDAADDLLCVDLAGRRIIKKQKKKQHTTFNSVPTSPQQVHTQPEVPNSTSKCYVYTMQHSTLVKHMTYFSLP